MKPEGNKEGNWTGWNAKPQRPIGYEDNAKAKFDPRQLHESDGSVKWREAREATCREIYNQRKGQARKPEKPRKTTDGKPMN